METQAHDGRGRPDGHATAAGLWGTMRLSRQCSLNSLTAPLWTSLIRVPFALRRPERRHPVATEEPRKVDSSRWGVDSKSARGRSPEAMVPTVLLTGAEIVAARQGIVSEVRQVLELVASPAGRTRETLHPHASVFLDTTLRAHLRALELLEGSRGRRWSPTLGPRLTPRRAHSDAKISRQSTDANKRIERLREVRSRSASHLTTLERLASFRGPTEAPNLRRLRKSRRSVWRRQLRHAPMNTTSGACETDSAPPSPSCSTCPSSVEAFVPTWPTSSCKVQDGQPDTDASLKH
jgi:hypothetical protein